MARRIGTLDLFDRGRFGDNEYETTRPENDSVTVTVFLLQDDASKKAIKVRDDTMRRSPLWLPRSQIKYRETEPGIAEVTMPQWLANKKKLW